VRNILYITYLPVELHISLGTVRPEDQEQGR
jgi:hypothetical protein